MSLLAWFGGTATANTPNNASNRTETATRQDNAKNPRGKPEQVTKVHVAVTLGRDKGALVGLGSAVITDATVRGVLNAGNVGCCWTVETTRLFQTSIAQVRRELRIAWDKAAEQKREQEHCW